MNTFQDSLGQAVRLVLDADPVLLSIVARSLAVSGTACVDRLRRRHAGLGAWLARGPLPRPRRAADGAQHAARAALGGGRAGRLPAAVALRPARASLGWLFTLKAMVLAQTLLVLPVVAALTRQVVEDAEPRARRAAALARRRHGCAARRCCSLGRALRAAHGAARGLRPRHRRSRRGDDRRRQHRRLHARDDHRHRAGDQQGRPAAGARARAGAARRGAGAQCGDRAGLRSWRERATRDAASCCGCRA